MELNTLEFSVDLEPDLAKTIADGYADDPELWHIINRLENSKKDTFHEKYFWDASKRRLYLIESSPVRLCIPRGSVRLHLLQENHDCPFAGHPGRDRTLWNLSKYFYWPRMGQSVKDFVRSCERCQRSKSSRNKIGLLQPLPVPEQPWQNLTLAWILSWDCQLPTIGMMRFTFSLIDFLSMYILFRPHQLSTRKELLDFT